MVNISEINAVCSFWGLIDNKEAARPFHINFELK
jgi:hypothetical protein